MKKMTIKTEWNIKTNKYFNSKKKFEKIKFENEIEIKLT